MGSTFEINDSLVITHEQGFPEKLNFKSHLKKNFLADDFASEIFAFRNKKDIRVYQIPPVRNFLVEKTNKGKWIYWGLVHILEITHDYKNKTTSGKFKIIYINTPEEMKLTHTLIDRDHETSYFV
jgi:hypothetical protein